MHGYRHEQVTYFSVNNFFLVRACVEQMMMCLRQGTMFSIYFNKLKDILKQLFALLQICLFTDMNRSVIVFQVMAKQTDDIVNHKVHCFAYILAR